MKKQIEIDDEKIFYPVSGNGQPVMLVYGFGETASPNYVPNLLRHSANRLPPKEGFATYKASFSKFQTT